MLAPLFNRLLKTNTVQRKYAAAYVVKYARDWGLRKLSLAVVRAVLAHGLMVIFRPRTVILASLERSLHAPPAGAAVPSGKQAASVIVPFDEAELRRRMQTWTAGPRISIVVPTYNTPAGVLVKMIRSVSAQVYSHWELCIADDCSTEPGVREVLDSYAGDVRIKVCYLEKNAGISAATNAAIKMATGEYIGLLDHDDEITGDALFWVVDDLNKKGAFDIIYSDECKVDEEGIVESDVFYKPAWSPELLFSMMYTGHFSVYRKAFLEEKVGYFRSEYDFSQDYDLFLRASAMTDNIRHIQKVLYKWRKITGSAAQGDKPYARKSNVAALADTLQARRIPGEALGLPHANRVKVQFDTSTLVSVIIPSDSLANIRDTVKSIISKTGYPAYELVVVTNSRLISLLEDSKDGHGGSAPRIVYVPYDKPYNFSDKCNAGAAVAQGEIVVFYNDDVSPLGEEWLENLVEWLWVPGVGGVSPLMLYDNDTIQYAGMVTGVRGLLGTAFHTYSPDSHAQFNFTRVHRNVSILSGACLAMRRSLFMELDGFDAVNTPINHSDVDLSFRIRERGLRLVFTAYSTLRHIGHLSLGEFEKEIPQGKKDKADMFIMKRWPGYLAEDPYFTRSMRDLLYHDSPEPFDFFAPSRERPATGPAKGDILLVGHDLSLSGAPLMLLELARILSGEGYFVVMSCEKDGPLRAFYQDEGIPVIIDALIFHKHIAFERLARNFDLIICNTIVSWPVADQMQPFVPTIWWIQEGQAIFHRFAGLEHILQALKGARHIIGASDYALDLIREYTSGAVRIYNASPDLYDGRTALAPAREEKGKLVFSLIGSLEYRKGQDLLLKALRLLDPSLTSSVEFRIIGRELAERDFNEPLEDLVGKQPFTVRFLGSKGHRECLELMQQSDVILCPSRDDPFPVVLTEAFSMAKTCIVSSHTGTAELITSGVNGYVFASGQAEGLADCIDYLLKHPERLRPVGLKARETYKQYLTMDHFKETMLDYIRGVLGARSYDALPVGQEEEAVNF